MSQEQKSGGAKKGGSKVVVIVLTGVLVAGAAVAGTMYGPKMLGAKPAAAHGAEEPAEASDSAPAGLVINFQPIVVDIQDEENAIHHLKVGIALELQAEKTEDELKNYVPRGREATIAYLRSREWTEITNAKGFEVIKKELSERVRVAIGKERVARVLVTDFVAQ